MSLSNDSVANDSIHGPVLAHATESATVNASLESIDLAKWIFTLGNEEYRQCAPGEHKACGVSRSQDDEPMSICVETVGGQLMVQHYVPDVMSRDFCRMTSISDVFTPPSWTTVHVTWEVAVAAASNGNCTFTNTITSWATPDFLASLNAAGVSVTDAASQRTSGVRDHNARETPAFAASIERFARHDEPSPRAGN